MQMTGLNEDDRVVSPENIPIHLNDLSTLGNTLDHANNAKFALFA